MEFYERYYWQYKAADDQTRKEAKEHWLKCHRENLKADRKDLIIFSAQILAMIDMAENDIKL